MIRLGDGDDAKSPYLGGGDPDSPDLTTGAKGGLFLGLRHARRQDALLAVAKPVHQDPILGHGETGGGDTGGGGDGGGGDGGDGGGGGDGGDG